MVTRIRQLLEHRQLTPTQFADLIGVGRPVMSHILSERNKPSLEVVQRIISAFPDISLPWLLSGTGEMLATGAAQEAATYISISEPAAAPSPLAEAETPAAAPALPFEALPRPFSPSKPAPAPLPVAPPSTQTAQAAEPGPVPGPESAAPVVPPVPKPFRAARFVPPVPSAPEAVAPVASLAPVPPASLPTAALITPGTPAGLSTSASPDAAMLPFLAEPGKAIRRIVIFYRDGSFADYQPE
jgi:transcriptional regulator with XRE-family HTH domain